MLTAKGIAGAAELTIAAAGKYSGKGAKTLNKDGKQRNESRIIKWNSFLLSLYPPNPCLDISVASFAKHISEDSAGSNPFRVLTLLPTGVKAISQKKREICLVTEGSFLH